MSDDLTLGRLLGRREAFTIVAARCSAADAVLLREMRQKKMYLSQAKDWGEFCAQHLHLSRENADRLIRLLDEFGPSYFEVAQLTRISPATYRAIAPAIRDQTLHHNGEAIALLPENAAKVAVAVSELRKAAEPVTPAAPSDPIPKLTKRCTELVAELEAIVDTREHLNEIRAAIFRLRSRIDRIELML
jgi:hypothetical protein